MIHSRARRSVEAEMEAGQEYGCYCCAALARTAGNLEIDRAGKLIQPDWAGVETKE